MLKLHKKTEYALLALRYLSRLKPAECATTRSIATSYNIPETLLAKVLQTLRTGSIVTATQGAQGGYALAQPLTEISLVTLFALCREQSRLVECIGDEACSCQQGPHCDIKGPLAILNDAMMRPIRHMSVADLFAGTPTLALGPIAVAR